MRYASFPIGARPGCHRPAGLSRAELDALFGPSEIEHEPPTVRREDVTKALAARERGLPRLRRCGL